MQFSKGRWLCRGYHIKAQVSEHQLKITCQEFGCDQPLGDDMLVALTPPDTAGQFRRFALQDFVTSCDKVRSQPSARPAGLPLQSQHADATPRSGCSSRSAGTRTASSSSSWSTTPPHRCACNANTCCHAAEKSHGLGHAGTARRLAAMPSAW